MTLREGSKVVVIDIETGGLDIGQSPLIQFAGIAVQDDWEEVASLQVKIQVDPYHCTRESLVITDFDPVVWQKEAIPEKEAILRIAKFLRDHATHVVKGSYKVARLCGHNAAKFDAPFLEAVFKRHEVWFPGSCYNVLDTLHLARWVFSNDIIGPRDFKLGTLLDWFGKDAHGAHDALEDVRATAAIAKELTQRLRAL